jgi:hypothetical protein
VLLFLVVLVVMLAQEIPEMQDQVELVVMQEISAMQVELAMPEHLEMVVPALVVGEVVLLEDHLFPLFLLLRDLVEVQETQLPLELQVQHRLLLRLQDLQVLLEQVAVKVDIHQYFHFHLVVVVVAVLLLFKDSVAAEEEAAAEEELVGLE